MQLISSLVPLVIAIVGVLIPINALNLKSNLGRTFFTDEQRIKVKFFNTFLFSLIMALGTSYFSLAIRLNSKQDFEITASVITSLLFLAGIVFLVLLLITSPLINWVNNFFIKNHFKYKVSIPDDNIGEVYILRMHDNDTCICSKDPNAEFPKYNSELQPDPYILIPMELVLKKNLILEQIPKPNRSVWSKLFDF
jgi:hypothetical protein